MRVLGVSGSSCTSRSGRGPRHSGDAGSGNFWALSPPTSRAACRTSWRRRWRAPRGGAWGWPGRRCARVRALSVSFSAPRGPGECEPGRGKVRRVGIPVTPGLSGGSFSCVSVPATSLPRVATSGGERRRSAQVCRRRFHPIVFSYQTKGTFLLKCFVCGAASKEHRVIEGGEKKKKRQQRGAREKV